MGIEAPAEMKFAMIQECLNREQNVLNISEMCKIAGVSRSGFYAWRASEQHRQSREEQDKKDFALILEAYRYRNRPKGARQVYMRLLHSEVRMNIKETPYK